MELAARAGRQRDRVLEHNFNPQDAVQIGGMTYAIKTNAFIPALGVTAPLNGERV